MVATKTIAINSLMVLVVFLSFLGIVKSDSVSSNDSKFYLYFPTSFIDLNASKEKTVDLYICSQNGFFGIVYLNSVHSNGIDVSIPSIVNLPKNSCLVEKVIIRSSNSYGNHYIYVYAKHRDEFEFSNKLNVYVERALENEITNRQLVIIPLISTDNIIEQGDNLLVKNTIKVYGIKQTTYLTAKLKVDNILIDRRYFKVTKDSTISFYSTIETTYFTPGYHYVILEVYTPETTNSTAKLLNIFSNNQENEFSNNIATNEDNTNNKHCLEFVDLKNVRVEVNKTEIIPIVLHNCGDVDEKNVVVKMIFDERTLINTIDEIKPNDYKIVKIYFFTSKSFDEKIARIIAYNENVSIDAGIKVASFTPKIYLMLENRYEAKQCSEKTINVRIANAGEEEFSSKISVASDLNYTISKNNFIVEPKQMISIPITFEIPCNASKTYPIGITVDGKTYYTEILVKKGFKLSMNEYLLVVLLVFALIPLAILFASNYKTKLRCFEKHKDELLF